MNVSECSRRALAVRRLCRDSGGEREREGGRGGRVQARSALADFNDARGGSDQTRGLYQVLTKRLTGWMPPRLTD